MYIVPLAVSGIPWGQINFDGSITPDVQALLDEPAFQELPAVKAGMLFPVRGATIYTFSAAEAMADDLEAAAQAITEGSGS